MRVLCLFMVVLAVASLEDTKPAVNESTVETLFLSPDEFPVSLLVKNLKEHKEERLNLTFNKKSLKELNVTKSQVENGYVEISPKGERDFIIEGQRFTLGISTDIVIHFAEPEGSSGPGMKINLNYFNQISMREIENDPKLIPAPRQKLSWETSPRCTIRQIKITIDGQKTLSSLNANLLVNITLDSNLTHKPIHVALEGLLLLVINPKTCKKSFETVMPTSDFGGYRDLIRSLRSIEKGKLILIASVRDGSALLIEPARVLLDSMGSLFIPYYLYRDIYFHLFIHGGKTLQENLVPNLGSYNTSGSPIVSSYFFDLHDFEEDLPRCPSWPTDDRWQKRVIFCDNYDGYKSLCSCEHPFEIPDSKGTLNVNNTESNIPIVVIGGNRTRHFFHLIQSIGHQDRVIKDLFLIVTDGYFQEIAELSFVLGLKLIVHKPEGLKSMKISRNFRFALFQSLKIFPISKAFIVLEEDLVVSPDFYSYMQQLQPLFNMDKSIFCVNAFNHLSFPHTSKDPSMLYRAQTYPAYGWMMSREIIKEILPKWLPALASHDWDYFVGSDLVRKSRECIIPDVNRSYHWATMGFHVKASYTSETFYLSRTLNKDPNVTVQPLESLLKDNYEKYFVRLLESSTRLNASTDDESFISSFNGNASYTIFVKQKTATDASSFRQAGEMLSVWSKDNRDSHNSAWKLHYYNATIFVIGYPYSTYSYLLQGNQTLISGNKDTDRDLDMGELTERLYTPLNAQKQVKRLPYPFWENITETEL